MDDIAISVEHLAKRFRLYHERHQSLKATVLSGGRSRYEEFWALDDVSFEVRRGESFGIVGSNGSGKSTLLKCLTGILSPDRGTLAVNGSISALLELGAGFHPELSGRENIYLNGAILGMGKKIIDQRFDSIVAFSGLERFIDSPLKNYSSGMHAKLGFSVAIHAEPEILIVDEVLSVGDEAFRRKSGERISEMRANGATIVFVSHGLGQVRSLCDRVMWLEKGVVRHVGAADEVLAEYVESATEAPAANPHGARWGTGEIRFSSIELFDSNGESVTSLRPGEPADFRLRWSTSEPVPRPTLSFTLFSAEGAEVAGLNTSDRDGLPAVMEGSGEIRVQLATLPLVPGIYDLSVSFAGSERPKPYDLWFKPFRFEMRTDFGISHRGVVALEPTYTCGPVQR